MSTTAPRFSRICVHPGCRVKCKGARCEKHKRKPPSPSQLSRASSTQRGYDVHWRRCVAMLLRERRWCEDCLERGEITLATEGHHLQKVADRPDLRLDPDNVRVLCSECHSIRSARGE